MTFHPRRPGTAVRALRQTSSRPHPLRSIQISLRCCDDTDNLVSSPPTRAIYSARAVAPPGGPFLHGSTFPVFGRRLLLKEKGSRTMVGIRGNGGASGAIDDSLVEGGVPAPPPPPSGAMFGRAWFDRNARQTLRILSSPPGSMGPSEAREAERCMDGWSRMAASLRRDGRAGGGGRVWNGIDVDADPNGDNPGFAALRLLERCRREEGCTGRGIVTDKMYEHTVNALSLSGGEGSALRVGEVWEDYVQLYISSLQSGRPLHHPPNEVVLSAVIDAHAKDDSDPDAAGRAEAILRRAVSLSSELGCGRGRQAGFFPAPTEHAFTAAIDAWGRRDKPEKSEMILAWMEELGGNGLTARPNCHTYNAVLAAWARKAPTKEDPKGPARRCEGLLRRMLDPVTSGKGSSPLPAPDKRSFGSVMMAWAACPIQPFGAQQAERILVEMEAMATHSTQGGPDNTYRVYPNAGCYNAVILGYSNTRDPESAERVLQHMLESHARNAHGERTAVPNVQNFNTVLRAWAKSGRPEAGCRAAAILGKLDNIARGASSIRPDQVTYNTVLDAWARSTAPNSALEAEKLLAEMERRWNERDTLAVKPDTISYSTVITAWAKENGTRRRGIGQDGPQRLQGKPGKSISFVPSAAGPNPAEHAERILRSMLRIGIQADVTCYNSCITAWARSGLGLEGAERAEALLEEMELSYKRPNSLLSSSVRPSRLSYSAVIDAHARSLAPGSAGRAEDVLKRMEMNTNIGTNIIAYNAVLNAWAKSREANAAERSENILRCLEGSQKSIRSLAAGSLPKPDPITYFTVINTWSKSWNSCKASRARSVLRRMVRSAEESQWGELWSSASSPKRGCKTSDSIRDAYNMVISACAYTPKGVAKEERANIFRIAVETYEELRASELYRPNHITYACFILACHRLVENSEKSERKRLKYIRASFQDCAHKGQITDLVLKRLAGAVTPDLYHQILDETEEVGCDPSGKGCT